MKPHPPRGRKFRQTKYAAEAESPNLNMSPAAGSSSTKGHPGFPSKLAESLNLIDSVFVRHKNQHRSQAWWKPLSLLRKALRKYVMLEAHESQLKKPVRTASAVHAVVDAKDVRRRFELEAQVRREREILGAWIRETLCPRCYVTFSGIVADMQFANLGVVLMGVLAEIAGVVGLPQGTDSEQDGYADVIQGTQVATRQARSLIAHSLQVVGAERGTVVERIYDSDDLGEVIERRRDPPNVREPTRTRSVDAVTRRSPTSGGAEESIGEATIVSTKSAPIENQLQNNNIEMEEDSATLGAFRAITPAHNTPAAKAKIAPAQHPRNRDEAQTMQEKRTKKSAMSSQTAAVSSLPSPSVSSKEHSSTASPSLPPKQPPSTKRNSPPQTAVTEVRRKQKRDNEGEEPGLGNNKADKITKRSGTEKNKNKKKRNAIDDMFAGFG